MCAMTWRYTHSIVYLVNGILPDTFVQKHVFHFEMSVSAKHVVNINRTAACGCDFPDEVAGVRQPVKYK